MNKIEKGPVRYFYAVYISGQFNEVPLSANANALIDENLHGTPQTDLTELKCGSTQYLWTGR